MSILNRFPSRIRFVNPDGTLTPEALRMLDLLVDRVGGNLGDQGEDVFAPLAGAAGAAREVTDVLGPASPAGQTGPEVASMPVMPATFGETTFQGSSE